MASSKSQEGLNNILSAINNVVESKEDTLKYDRTYRAIVKEKVEDNLYKVEIDNVDYNLNFTGTLENEQIIHVKAPLNNFSDIYIEGEGGGSPVTIEPSNTMTAYKEGEYILITSEGATYFNIDFDKNTSSGSGLTLTEDGGIKIGKNIKKVLVSANIQIYAAGSTNNRHLRITKGKTDPNDTNTMAWSFEICQQNTDNNLQISPTLIDVTEGDEIYLWAYLYTNDVIGKNTTYGKIISLTVEDVTYVRNIGTGGGGGTSDYNDLENKPVLNTTTDTPLLPNASEVIKDTINLHKVSKTGSYQDLNEKPGNATTSEKGFMSATDKTKLDNIEPSAQVNKIEKIQKNGTDLPITDKIVNVPVPTKTSELTNDGDGNNPFITTIPIATVDSLGGVKIGENITVSADGTISAISGVAKPSNTMTAYYTGQIAANQGDYRVINMNGSTIQGSNLSLTSDGGIKIGAGITKVLVSAQATIITQSTGNRHLRITKGTTSTPETTEAWCTITTGTNGSWSRMQITPVLIDVNEGDTLYLQYYAYTNDVLGTDTTWGRVISLSVEDVTYLHGTVVEDNLTSTSTINALSANQGRILNESKVSKSGDSMTGALSIHVDTISPLEIKSSEKESSIRYHADDQEKWVLGPGTGQLSSNDFGFWNSVVNENRGYLQMSGLMWVNGGYYDSGNAIQALPSGDNSRDYWNHLENGIYWYSNTGSPEGMPEQFGFVEKRGFTGDGDFTVLFYTQNKGPIYRKSGNVNGISNWYPITVITKNGNQGYGLCNTDGISIVRDYGNNCVTVDATGATLFLGWENTTGIDFLNGLATMSSSGFVYPTSGLYSPNAGGVYFDQYGNIHTRQNMTSGTWTIRNVNDILFQLEWSNKYCTLNGGLKVANNITCNNAIYVDSGSIRSEYIYNQNVVSNATNMYITSNGWIRRTTNTSSRKYKKEIKELQDEELNPEKLYEIPIRQFKYKEEYQPNENDARYDKTLIGLIAEEVEDIYPIAVDYEEDENGEKHIENWNERYIIPAMLKLIQDQKKDIDYLKEEIENLKNKESEK